MRVIRKRPDIRTVEETDEAVFFGFRPSSKDLFELFEKSNVLKVLYLPKSYSKSLSRSMLMFLEMKKIQIIAGGIRDNDAVESCYILNENIIDREEGETEGEKPGPEHEPEPAEKDNQEDSATETAV